MIIVGFIHSDDPAAHTILEEVSSMAEANSILDTAIVERSSETNVQEFFYAERTGGGTNDYAIFAYRDPQD
jgi:hypothetical protein